MELDHLIGSILGPYRVLEALGEGGMARVYKAVHPRLKRTVALKVISPDAADRPGFRERFEREAQLIARLHHPNVVTVYDFGEADGLPYLVMQYVGGGTLSSRLKRGQPLSVAPALTYTIQMAHALQHAHSQGIIHRDIKPANMLLDELDPSRLLLADFGIAKLLSTSAEAEPGQPEAFHRLTATGGIIGTPQFMAPEQAQGGAVDAHTDIYALGVVLYLLLTGQLPFRAPTPLEVLYQHLYIVPPSVSSINAAVSPSLAHIVSLALAKRPEERFPSAEAFAHALEAWLPSVSAMENAPTFLSQGGQPVTPGSMAAIRDAALASLPTPFLTHPADPQTPRPAANVADATPALVRNVPSISQPEISLAIPAGEHYRQQGFSTAPTPFPGQLQNMASPPWGHPRRALPWLTSAASLLLLLAALLVIPGSPFRWPFGLSVNAPPPASTSPTTSANQRATPGGSSTITDTFMVNTLGWPTGHINNDPGLDWKLGNGLYDLVIPEGAPYALSYPVLPRNLGVVSANFTLELKIKQLRGSSVVGYGLVFRTTALGSSFQGDTCTIETEGGYQCLSYPSQAPHASFTTNTAILSGLNQLNDLKIVVQGGVLTFSVNGTVLPLGGPNGTLPSPLYSSGQVGLLVTGPGTEFQCTAFVLTPLP